MRLDFTGKQILPKIICQKLVRLLLQKILGMAESGGVEMRQNKQMLSAIKCDNRDIN